MSLLTYAILYWILNNIATFTTSTSLPNT